MGGVFFLIGGRPYLWRKAFQPKVASELFTLENTKGTIIISDIKLASTLAQSDVLRQLVDVG
jgi:hypothetical protein